MKSGVQKMDKIDSTFQIFPHILMRTRHQGWMALLDSLMETTACLNCEVEIDGGEFCPACRWLSRRGPISPRGTSDERLVNRRWQMRFNRGELK